MDPEWRKFLFSRKFVAASLTVGMIFLGGLICIFSDGFREIYTTYCTAVGGVFAAYTGSHVVSEMTAPRPEVKSEPKKKPAIEPLPE